MTWQLRPARDLQLAGQARLRSHARESGLGSIVLHGAWRQLVRLHLRLYHRLRVTGRENLPPRPPFVLVANHASHLDALTLMSVLRGENARSAFALAAGDTFFTTKAATLFAAYAVNALPIWRKRTQRSELEMLRDRLQQDGLVYILFPEGTRSRDGSMARFQPGLGAFVAGTEVPVVPCHLQGAHAAWPAQAKLPRPRPLRLAIGAPLSFADLPADRSGWMEVAARTEAAVRALAEVP